MDLLEKLQELREDLAQARLRARYQHIADPRAAAFKRGQHEAYSDALAGLDDLLADAVVVKLADGQEG
jgi:hypothetical protein